MSKIISFLKLPFNFKLAKRLNRWQHLKVQLIGLIPLIIFLLPVILVAGGDADFKDGTIPNVIYILIDIFVVLPWMIISISAGIARLHDCNRSGWWMLPIIFLSFATALPMLLLFIWPGLKEANEYGNPSYKIRR